MVRHLRWLLDHLLLAAAVRGLKQFILSRQFGNVSDIVTTVELDGLSLSVVRPASIAMMRPAPL